MTRMRRAAAVMLTRGAGPEVSVLLVERVRELRFFGGYFAFPGGTLDPGDPDPAHCAVRELREEIGLELEVKDLLPLGRLTTPEFAPVRYETEFFLARCPEGREPSPCCGELASVRFVDPAEALAEWRAGETAIVPPVLFFLEEAAKGFEGFRERARAGIRELERGRLHPVFFRPGILLAALRTATLPPATTTNCLLVGEARVHVVDPGTMEEGELRRLFDLLDGFRAEGRKLEGILLTHDHPDHCGGAIPVAERYGIPVRAHFLSLQHLPEGLDRRPLAEGDRLELGRSPDGRPGWSLHAVETPGHHPGHLVFFEDRYRSLIAGDLVSTVSTILIDPPEGRLADYLDSLRRVRALRPETLFPAHGPAVQDGVALLDRFLEHRREREELCLEALAEGPRTREELLPLVYADTEPLLHAAASRSLLAGLRKLEEEGRVRVEEGRWRLETGSVSDGAPPEPGGKGFMEGGSRRRGGGPPLPL